MRVIGRLQCWLWSCGSRAPERRFWCGIGNVRQADDEVPQAPAVRPGQPGLWGAIERAGAPVEEEAPGLPGRRRVGGQPDRGIGPVVGRPQQRPHDPAEAGKRRREPGGCGPARMHRAERDLVRRHAPGPLADQRDLGALRLGVGARPVPRPAGPCQVVEVERLGVHPARRDGDDPCVPGAAKRAAAGRRSARTARRPWSRASPRGHRADGSLGEHRAGVVDHDVESGFTVAIRSTASRTERSDAMSATTAVARSAPCAAASSSRTDPEPRRVTPDEHDAGTEPGQAAGHRATESGGRTGHEDGPSAQGVSGRVGPVEQASAGGAPDPGEAADDRQLEQAVDQHCEHRGRARNRGGTGVGSTPVPGLDHPWARGPPAAARRTASTRRLARNARPAIASRPSGRPLAGAA